MPNLPWLGCYQSRRVGATPYKSVAEKGNHMKRTDITALFPDATDEQINTIMNLNGTDVNNAKNGLTDLQGQLTTAQQRIKELEKRPTAEALSALQTELDGLKAANSLRDMRASVAKETGVPVELITADTEDAARAQAKGILDFAQPGSYPAVKDGGEPQDVGKNGIDAAWQQLAAQISQNS